MSDLKARCREYAQKFFDGQCTEYLAPILETFALKEAQLTQPPEGARFETCEEAFERGRGECQQLQSDLAAAKQEAEQLRAQLAESDFANTELEKRIAELEARIPKCSCGIGGTCLVCDVELAEQEREQRALERGRQEGAREMCELMVKLATPDYPQNHLESIEYGMQLWQQGRQRRDSGSISVEHDGNASVSKTEDDGSTPSAEPNDPAVRRVELEQKKADGEIKRRNYDEDDK
jgi:DNA repair exonuclease SbcCD ATPase subunit